MKRLGAFLVAVGVGGSCDAANDVPYQGDALFSMTLGIVHVDEAPPVPLRAAVAWSAVLSGPGHVRIDAARFSGNPFGEARVDVMAFPPEAAFLDVDEGALALGEVFLFADANGDGGFDEAEVVLGRVSLIAFAREEAQLGTVTVAPEEFVALDAMGPCAMPSLSFVTAPRGERRIVRLEVADGASRTPLFASADCAEQVATFEGACPRFETIRGVCRSGLLDAAARARAEPMCARCAWLAFPEAADAHACREWRSRWDRHVRDPGLMRELEEVLAELRLCLAGEPPPTYPCDQECACEAALGACLEDGDTSTSCELRHAECLVF